MIIVTGANGQLGRAIVEELLKRMPADQVGVSVRDPEKAQDLARRGVRVRRGDFDDAPSLSQSFEGASQVLLISSNSGGENAVRQHSAAIDAAKGVGVGRILYTSHVGASSHSPFSPMIDHAATEAALKASGVAFTVLRNGFYASTVSFLLGRALTTGELALPEDGPVSWTSHADLAEATAVLLATNALLPTKDAENRVVNLTASHAVDFQAVASLASEVLGRPIVRAVVTDEAFLSGMVSQGVPEVRAAMTLGIFRASRLGQFALIDPALPRLLGRPPVLLGPYLRTALALGK